MATSTRPGDVLAGRYRLIDLLTESGGGRFWRARDTMLERFVALHVINEADPRGPQLLEAARASARVHDPRVLRVLDADTLDHLTYIVNEWGTGTSLDVLLTHGGVLGPRRSSWLVAQVASAIATAHAADVSHGRLNPENVLIDRYGAIRLIGLGVDAALHGMHKGRPSTDRADLAGLLYCCLTGTWPGPSPSQVPAAPREHGAVIPPRRVRHGVPRALDDIWREVVASPHRRRHGHPPVDVSSAAAIRDRLREFIGDDSGLQQALASSIPAINELRPVDLPAVADPLPYDRQRPEPAQPAPAPVGSAADIDDQEPTDAAGDGAADAGEPPADELPGPAAAGSVATGASATDDEPAAEADTEAADTGAADAASDDLPANVSISDLPTEAGLPVFDDNGEVEWFRAGRTEPPPPPPLEEPPQRPLFAPEPSDGEPVRRPRPGTEPPKPAYLDPIPSSPAPPPPDNPWEADLVATAEQPVVPGRNWLRLGLAIAAALLLLVAIVVAFNLGRGRTPLGGDRDDPTGSQVPAVVLTPAAASDFDPFGSQENPHLVDLVLDGDPETAWRTMGYRQQFGPGGLKEGVGLLFDLGQSRQVAEVEVLLVNAPTTVELYVYEEQPNRAPDTEPAAEVTAENTSLRLVADEPVDGQWVLLWLTEIPHVGGEFPWRGEIAEVTIHGR